MSLTTLFFAWTHPENLTDIMLAAFKRIRSPSNTKTAWSQVVCYLLDYGYVALIGATFIKRYSSKNGVLLGIGPLRSWSVLVLPNYAWIGLEYTHQF